MYHETCTKLDNGQQSWRWMVCVGNEVGTTGVRDAHDEPACNKDHG